LIKLAGFFGDIAERGGGLLRARGIEAGGDFDLEFAVGHGS
jgi:hypothetical protein